MKDGDCRKDREEMRRRFTAGHRRRGVAVRRRANALSDRTQICLYRKFGRPTVLRRVVKLPFLRAGLTGSACCTLRGREGVMTRIANAATLCSTPGAQLRCQRLRSTG